MFKPSMAMEQYHITYNILKFIIYNILELYQFLRDGHP